MEKKPFYKRWWFILIIVFVGIGAIGEVGNIIGEETNETEQAESAEEVEEKNDNEGETTEEVEKEIEDVEETAKEPVPEPDEVLTREEEIKRIIRDRAKDTPGYTGFRVDKIRVNENLGDEESDTYIVLVDLTWKTKNKVDRANERIDSVSQDIAANLYDEGADDVAEVVIFTIDEYNNRDIKYSSEWSRDGFVITDKIAN